MPVTLKNPGPKLTVAAQRSSVQVAKGEATWSTSPWECECNERTMHASHASIIRHQSSWWNFLEERLLRKIISRVSIDFLNDLKNISD